MMESLGPLVWMIGAMLVVLMLVTFVPDLALFLPRHMQ
jgi:TRAP-type C4-dicarboxylate transport system permease large subunit